MAIESLVVSGAGKVASTWLGPLLSQWLKDRDRKSADKALWDEVVQLALAQTQATIERHSKILTVAFPKDPVNLGEIYVPLKIKNKRNTLQLDSYPAKLLEKYRKMLVIDVAGMGKSTAIKVIYLRALEEKQAFPLLIDLRRLSSEQTIESCLLSQFGLKPRHEDIFSEFLRTQPLLFLFDGFDEVPDKEKVAVARDIRDFVDRNNRAMFVITSRPEAHFSNFTDFETFQFVPLTKIQAHELITKYGNAYGIPERARALLDELRARHDDAVSTFLQNPLLTSLLFRAFEYKSIVPVKRGVFYAQVFDALYVSHDLNKETGYVRDKKTGLHHDDFHRVLRAMASLFRKKKVVEVTVAEFIEMAKAVERNLCPDLNFLAEDLLADTTKAVPVFVKDGNFIRWAHKSLLDYFLSQYLLLDYSESKEEALRRVAFGIDSLSNENFLTLVHESDPSLFTKAVTLPAIDTLLARYDEIAKKLQPILEKEALDDICIFYMGYEILLSSVSTHGSPDWTQFMDDAEENASLNSDDYIPTMIFTLGPKDGSIGIFMCKALAALTVALKSGGLSMVSLHSLSKKRVDPDSYRLTPIRKSRALFGSHFRSGKWVTIEDEFGEAVDKTSASLVLPAPASLRRARQELDYSADNALKARGDDIF